MPALLPAAEEPAAAPQRLHTGKPGLAHLPYCGKAFRRPSDLFSATSALHTGERPYRCPQCGRAFNRNHHLAMHMQTHARGQGGAPPCPGPHLLGSLPPAPAQPGRRKADQHEPAMSSREDLLFSPPPTELFHSCLTLVPSRMARGEIPAPAPCLPRSFRRRCLNRKQWPLC